MIVATRDEMSPENVINNIMQVSSMKSSVKKSAPRGRHEEQGTKCEATL